ncbi:hypothetical protein [Deinococcus radiophilus]|uniref:hypothetical protein n=1 Tax=Deinococcus radiophilus TaxID=32062 RepID=UPI0036223A37
MTAPRPTTLEDAATLPAPTAETVLGRYVKGEDSNPRSAADREKIMQNMRFGAEFSDHMASARWTADTGWTEPKLLPYGPIPLDPSANVLHYAQEVFEASRPTVTRTAVSGCSGPCSTQRVWQLLPGAWPFPNYPPKTSWPHWWT